MSKLAFVHIINENLGDASCCPRRHFAEYRNCVEVDFRAMPAELFSPEWTLIVGGGGLLHPGIDRWIFERATAQRVILWGVGLNYHDGTKIPDWRRLVAPCVLATIRDAAEAESPVEFCPCPSSLSAEFDTFRDYKPTNEVVCFEHYQRPMGFLHPTRNNRRDGSWTFAAAIGFLASGRRVITNSFHGAYWAALLGRPALVWQPFSTRFRSGLASAYRDFAHTPEEARDWLKKEIPAPRATYLDDCRVRNRRVFARVQKILETSA